MKIFDQVVHEDHQFFYLYLFWYTESANLMESNRESYLNIMKELNQELSTVQEQCRDLHRINKQLLIENENSNNEFNDRSIVVGHQASIDLNEEVCLISFG
jgi:hypothetical protein